MQPVRDPPPIDLDTLGGVARTRCPLTGKCRLGHIRTYDAFRLATLYGSATKLAEAGQKMRCSECNSLGLRLAAGLRPTKPPRLRPPPPAEPTLQNSIDRDFVVRITCEAGLPDGRICLHASEVPRATLLAHARLKTSTFKRRAICQACGTKGVVSLTMSPRLVPGSPGYKPL